jgi:hypothetical protein
MRAARFRLPVSAALVLAGISALVANCSQSDTVVLVRVTATAPIPEVVRLHTTLKIADLTRVIDVPMQAQPITFPTTFSVQLARSLSGDLSITIDALDSAMQVVASAGHVLAGLSVGNENQVTIDLSPGTGTDGGLDDGSAPDAAGAGGAAGGGGQPLDGGPDQASSSGGAGGSVTGPGGGGASGHAGAGGRGGTAGAAGRGGAIGVGGITGTGGAGTGGGAGGSSGMGGTAAGGAGASGAAAGGGGGDAGGASGGGGDSGGASGQGGAA